MIMLLVLFLGVASVFIFMYVEVPYIPIDHGNDSHNESDEEIRQNLVDVFIIYKYQFS